MIRGTKRRIPEIKIDAGIHNRFVIELVDAKSGRVRKAAVAHNIICDQMWDRFAAKSAWFNYIQYGSGSGTPSTSDKSLFAYSGYKQASTDKIPTINRKECVAHITRNIQLSETEAVGVTITEVGIAYSTKSSTLVTHAMLKDMNGNPVSIEKTDTDILNIYATVYAHWPEEYGVVTNPVRLIPDYYNNADNYRGIIAWMLGIVGNPPSVATLSTSMVVKTLSTLGYAVRSTPAFDALTKKLSISFERFPVQKSNIAYGSHGAMIYHGTAQYSGPFGPCLYFSSEWFGGSDIIGEAVGTGDGVTKDFSTKFDLPTDAEVYVDGAFVDAIVDEVPLNCTNMQAYFDMISVEDGIAYPCCNAEAGYSAIYGDDGFFMIPHGTYYNPYYRYGIKRLVNGYGNKIPFSVSNDLLTWTDLGEFNSNGTDIPEEYRFYKYWKFGGSTGCRVKQADAVTLTGKNIHFAEAPAEGSVITINYHTPTIAKDENHVYDLTLTIQLNEYTE